MNPLSLINAIRDNNLTLAYQILDGAGDISGAVGVDINKQDNLHQSALWYSVEGRHHDLIEKILSVPGIDVNRGDEYGETPIDQAWFNDDAISYKLLIDAGVDDETIFEVYSLEDEPIAQAILSNKPNILNYYLELNPDLVEVGEFFDDSTLLAFAVSHNVSIEIGKVLLKHGSYINSVNDEHFVLLSLAPSLSWIKFLIENGADVNFREAEEFTPLHYHARYSSDKIIIYLLEQGADPWAENADGITPVDEIGGYGTPEALEYVFKHYGIGNLSDSDGSDTFLNKLLQGIEFMSPNEYDEAIRKLKLCFYYGVVIDDNIINTILVNDDQNRDYIIALIDSLRFSLTHLSYRSIKSHRVNVDPLPSILFEDL